MMLMIVNASIPISEPTLTAKVCGSLLTVTGAPPLIKEYSSQGTGRPTVTSKMLEPIEEDTAMSPCPWRVTSTDVSKSGTEVPPAMRVRARMRGSMPVQAPTSSEQRTMTTLMIAIQTIEIKKVSGYNFLQQPSLRQSGQVTTRTN